MPAHQPKSILKKTSGPGAGGRASAHAGPSTLAKNTKQNAASQTNSKLKKSVNVRKPKPESESEDDEDGDDSSDEDVDMSEGEEESEVDTDEEIRRASAPGEKKKTQSESLHRPLDLRRTLNKLHGRSVAQMLMDRAQACDNGRDLRIDPYRPSV